MSFWWNDEGETDYFTFHWWNVAEQEALQAVKPGYRPAFELLTAY